MTILRDRATMSPEHIRIAELAKEDRERKFSSIAHLLTVEALQEAFKNLRKDASAGVDRVTYTEYAAEARANLHDDSDLKRAATAGGVERNVGFRFNDIAAGGDLP